MNYLFNLRPLCTLLLVLLNLSAFAQGNFDACELAERETRCFVFNSETLWTELISDLESDPNFENDESLQYAWVKCQYGLAGVYMATYDTEKGAPVVAKAVEMNQRLLKKNNKNADYHAMLSALYGLQIGFSPMKGMFLGAKSDKHINKAVDLEPENGFAWLQKGMSYFHTPSMFGGDKGEAVKCFRKATELLEHKGDLSSNWQWLEAMTWLGQAYAETNQLTVAKTTYERALEEFPDFAWIKMALLPSLNKKLN